MDRCCPGGGFHLEVRQDQGGEGDAGGHRQEVPVDHAGSVGLQDHVHDGIGGHAELLWDQMRLWPGWAANRGSAQPR